MKILFTGDINFRGWESAESRKGILDDLLPYFHSVDYKIVNLETPLAKAEIHKPISKSGPNLICDRKFVSFLKLYDFNAVTLANNHIGDYGENAVLETLNLLKSNDILYAGAGKNIQEAYHPVYFENKVAVISVCENEFGTATENSAGSAGYSSIRLIKAIKFEKNKGNTVIIAFHGGNEHNPIPSPKQTERYRMLCEVGADAIIGCHTHCPQGYEMYNGKPIIYSMGNFLFKSSSDLSENDRWHIGYAVTLDIKKTGEISFEIIPYQFDKNVKKLEILKNEKLNKFFEYIQKINKPLKDEQLQKNYFSGWCYLHKWLSRMPEDFLNAEGNIAPDYDLLTCEAHNEQQTEVYRMYHFCETEKAKQWAEQIKELFVIF